MVRYKIQVFGKVQGVYFRATTQSVARKLELFGFVQNKLNGSVYIEVEGDNDKVNEFINWCHTGSKHSKVEKVLSEQSTPIGEHSFNIRY